MKWYINIYPALDYQKEIPTCSDIRYVGYVKWPTRKEADEHAGGGRLGVLVIDDSK